MRVCHLLPVQLLSGLVLSSILMLSFFHPLIAQELPEQHATEQIPEAMVGQWRGVIELQDGVYLSLGLNISAQGMTLDSPNQGMFERAPTEFTVVDGELSFIDQELGARYEGELEDGVLVGTFEQGRAMSLRIHRLTDSDRQRLTYEGTYQGDLQVNAQTALPLRVNIAVLHSDSTHGPYLATLDSPAQQSFGIPVQNVQVSGEQLSFESSMISATFQGDGSDGSYEGTFFQGMPYPLTLQKVSDEAPLADVSKPEPGAQGGAMAALTRSSNGEIHAEHSFFQGHTEQTQYEIGSVTKTMVAYLLAKLTENGVVSEDDTAATWIAETDEAVTLVSLATHHSGLPRLPANLFDTADPDDPYAHYDEQDLRSALRDTPLNTPNYEYSNYAFGLLGESLAQATQQSFAGLMDAELFAPAGMQHSYVALSDTAAGEYLSQGFDGLGGEAAAWHFEALAGAGAVVADLRDMQTYIGLMMNLAEQDNALAERLLSARYPMGDCCEQGLAWILQADPTGRMTAWHGGQTGGYSAFVGFYLDGSAGIVWLNAQSVDHSREMLNKLWALGRD